MCWKIRKNCRVARPAACDELHDVRERVGELVGKAEARAGSRELAYLSVGRAIGRSASWVYRLTTGKPVSLKWATWRRIVDAYARHAELLDRDAAASRANAAALRREADAMVAPSALAPQALAPQALAPRTQALEPRERG